MTTPIRLDGRQLLRRLCFWNEQIATRELFCIGGESESEAAPLSCSLSALVPLVSLCDDVEKLGRYQGADTTLLCTGTEYFARYA